jgi:BASS family bile acid:Na+ symporter
VPVAGSVFATTFILGWAIQKTGVLFKLDKRNIISLVLQGTLKNQGIAGGLAIALFEKEAALPSAIYSVFLILYFIWLDWRKSKT